MSMPNKDCLKLRECPFCGGEADIIRDPEGGDEVMITCGSFTCVVNVDTGWCANEQQAVEAWNRRTNDDRS